MVAWDSCVSLEVARNTCMSLEVTLNTCVCLEVTRNTCVSLEVTRNTCVPLEVTLNTCVCLEVTRNTCVSLVVTRNTCVSLGPSAGIQLEAAWPSQRWAQGQQTHPTVPKRFTSLPLSPVEEMQPSPPAWRSSRVTRRGRERCKVLEVAVETIT